MADGADPPIIGEAAPVAQAARGRALAWIEESDF
jgi:hypothetical protein